jgi:multidrug resistance efflux pump
MIRKMIVPLFVLAVVAATVVYYKATTRSRNLVLTGIVTTNDVILSSQIQGQLAQLLVKEGDAVKAGQLVAVIEPEELRADKAFYAHAEEGAAAQVQEAEGSLKFQEAQTRDQIRQADAALASVEALQAEAAADLERARLDYQRADGLFQQRIVSAQALDQARTTYAAQKARLESVQKQVEAQRATLALARSTAEQIGVRRSQLLAGQHQLAAAEAQRARAQVRLSYTEIHTPIAGVVALRAARHLWGAEYAALFPEWRGLPHQ